MRAAVVALAGALLSALAAARRERIVGMVPDLESCRPAPVSFMAGPLPAPDAAAAGAVDAAVSNAVDIVDLADDVEAVKAAEAFNTDNTGLPRHRGRDSLPKYARLHQIWSLRFWLRDHRPSPESFLATTAHILNMTAPMLADRLAHSALAHDEASAAPSLRALVEKLYCQGLVLQAWLLYPQDPFDWPVYGPWPEEGVPAHNVSDYVPASRLRPVMGALYARPDGSSKFVVVR